MSLSVSEAARLEAKLHRAMERAISEGWYPRAGCDLTDDGGCCLIGAIMAPTAFKPDYRGVVGNVQLTKKLPPGLANGFDGYGLEFGDDPRAYAIGRRFAKRYL